MVNSATAATVAIHKWGKTLVGEALEGLALMNSDALADCLGQIVFRQIVFDIWLVYTASLK